jgi:hypothetical protein
VLIRDVHTAQVEWLQDSRTAVVTSVDGTVVLFDAERGQVRATLPASIDGGPGYARVIPDPAGEIVVFNDDRVALRYPMDPAVWLREACAVAGRDLTRAEWDRYVPGREWQPTCSALG